ncbi:hypothetical protein [Aquimarina spongiae]|uniref:Uncharacterized protein n=1 Tax=Aquimarina spongiae TaxID=570521 RepID=A0A1M6AKE8_9FLAO|nr:hypothetical protein [Aquimarina spongiae]SHI36887.1 hypothetical protein SAMN04488508_101337 [Aquimarina spongiae]
MNTFKILTSVILLGFTSVGFSQTTEKPKENSSEETVTKIIRIKGANGEEKVITKQEVITKKSKIELNPGDEDKTNQSAIYSDQEVQVQKSESSSDMDAYTKVTDGKGFVITLLNKTGNQVCKARPLSNGYYIINAGGKDNTVGHFDNDKNLILESYDSNTDEVITTIYKLK